MNYQGEQQLLVLMVGVPGAGKSTFARQLAERIDAVRLNADGMRYALFDGINAGRTPANKDLTYRALFYAAKQILKTGNSLIFDSQHSTFEDRQHRRDLAEDTGALSVVTWIKTPLEIALERGLQRPPSEEHLVLDPDRMVEIIERSVRKQEPLQDSENPIEIDGLQPFDQQYATFQEQLGRLSI